MNAYLLNLLLLLVGFIIVHCDKLNPKLSYTFFFYWVGLQIFLFHALKCPSAFNDTPEYKEAFQYMCDMGWSTYMDSGGFILKSEIGYVVLMWVVSCFSVHPQSIFVVTSALIVGGYLYSIKKYSYLPWLSILLFLLISYNMSLFVLRQFIAMAICFNLMGYILKRDFLKFLIGICIAFSFHQTAFIFFPLYFLYPVSINRRFYVCAIISTLMLSVLASTIYNFIGEILVGYESYMDENQEGTNSKGLLLLLVVDFLYFIYCKGGRNKGGIDKLLFLALNVGIVISFVGLGLVATSRLNMYYSGLLYLIIPNLLYNVKNANTRWFLGGGICVFFAFYFLRDLPDSYFFFWESNIH